jgi:hypothetical protein
VAGSCEHGNEPLGSTKSGEFLDYLMTISCSRKTLLHGVKSVSQSVSLSGSSYVPQTKLTP